MNIAIFIIIKIIIAYSVAHQCLNKERNRQFHKIKKCYRSDATIISRSNSNSLKECINIAREKKGLAFNFSPKEAKKNGKGYFTNCQILGCPEMANLTTLIPDPAYDYYSSYGNFTVINSSICIKSVGLFHLFVEKENYTMAIDNCQQIGGDLANIVSETRTNSLSNLISTSLAYDWYKVAYVGLDDMNREGHFEQPLGDPIDCYKFRAWSPGHPRNIIKSDDCVVLDTDKSWRVVDCRLKLPYICEFYSSNYRSNDVDYRKVDCDYVDDPAKRRECRRSKRVKKGRRRNRCLR